MFAHCFRPTYQKMLAALALVCAACITATIDAAQVKSEARRWTLKLQESSDPQAQACHRAATAATVAAANVQGTQLRGQAVSDELWESLKSADYNMQSACSEISR